MPRNLATKAERNAPPASQTRPKLATTRPEPVDEPLRDFAAGIDAARLADDYDAIRIKLAEFETEKKAIEAKLIAAMKASGKRNFGTMHGRVSFLPKTESTQVPDDEAAIALLTKHGIPQPPTLEVWLAQHKDADGNPLQMPTKEKAGLPDRVKFEMNK